MSYTRDDVIKDILMVQGPDAIYVFSLGYISRAGYKLCEGKHHAFYMLGSMGLTSAIAKGIAMHTDRDVFAVQGDGDWLMCPNEYDLPNLSQCLLSNERYESTGGQPCIGIEGTHNIDPSPPDPRITKDPKEIARDIIHCLAG